MKKGVILLVAVILIFGIIGVAYAHDSNGGSSFSSDSSSSESSSDSTSDSSSSDSTSSDSDSDTSSSDSSESSEPSSDSSFSDSEILKDSDKKIGEDSAQEKESEELQTFIDENRDKIQIIPSDIEIKIKEDRRIKQKIKLRDIEAISNLRLNQEKDTEKINAKLSNGINAEVKIMPNTASRIALAKLKSQNRTLELKEVGEGDYLNVIYVSEADKTTKFLGLFKIKYKLKVEIDAQTGKIIKLHKPWWNFLATKDLEESEIKNMTLQLIKPIQDIIILKNTEELLDLDEYFLNAESYSVSEIENISLILDKSVLILTPEANYTGTTFATITAYKEDEILETLFNIIISEENLSVQTIQYPAILGEKVKWKKIIKAEKQKMKINLPKQSEDITLFKFDKNEQIIGEEKIIGDFVEIETNKNVEFYEIEYYTPEPYFIEESIVKARKKITIVSPENVHYTDVLVFDYLPMEVKSEIIKLYLITEKGREEIKIDKYDLNENGLVDYIEWIVPSLNNETYELIIEIVGAEHLDSDRNFISDIYNEVYELDNIWSEVIPSEDYIRVTFKTELDNTRDIKLYPRVISGTPRIEVYEVNGTEIIAEFTSINSNTYNQVLLTNLQGTQDTFDLRIVGGSLEIDHIIDPAVTLNSPLDNTYSNNPIQIFNCSATDEINLANITLYGSWSGGWHANETNDVTGISNSTTFTKTLSDGSYIWNCMVYDNDTNLAWFISNYTLTIDTIFPQVSISFPQNITYNADVFELNYTYAETNPDSCWWSNNSGIWNSTPQTCGTNWTGLTSNEGSNTWAVYINDTTGNTNSTSITFFKDTVAPVITIDSPANTSYNTKTIDLNVSADETIETWWYSNNSGINNNTFTPNQTYTWEEGSNTIHVWANDSLGNEGTKSVTFFIDSIYPLIDYGTGISDDDANLSQSNIYVNVSVTETNEDTITFLLYNSTGQVNSTSYSDGTRTINWTGLNDGDYTYNVAVNDTLGNSNATSTKTIILDITSPIVSFSCSSTSVYIRDVIICSCSGTDVTSGVQTTSHTSNPSTSDIGTYSTSCTITDYASNSASSSIDYLVKSHGGGYPNYQVSSQNLFEGYTKIMSKNWKMNFKINDDTHTLLIDDVDDDGISITLFSNTQKAILNIGEEKKFELTEDNYYDLLVRLNSIKNSLANLTIQLIHEEVLEDVVEKEIVENEELFEEEKNLTWLWVVVIIIVLIYIGMKYKFKKIRK